MAQKRPSSVVDHQQPSPSSSDQDHEEEEQEQDEEQEEEEEVSSSSEEEDENVDEQPAPPPAPAPAPNKKPTSKKPPPPSPPPPAAKSQPQPQPSDSATESDSESGPESDDPPVSAANPKAKPVAAKPPEESPKPKKLPSSRSSSKRAAENNHNAANEPKRAKKKVADSSGAGGDDEIPATEEDGGVGGGKKSGNDSKKLFQRIWSEEDEVSILKGLAEFTSKTGVDPYKEANAFHEFIKKSLHGEFSSNQLKEKIRRLKKKFENNAGKGKNGEDPKFAKPHEQRAFELSKMVWANGGGRVEQEKSKLNAKTKKIQKDGGGGGGSKNVGSAKPKVEQVLMDLKEDEQKGNDENGEDLMRMIRFDNVLGVSGLNEDVLKRGVGLIGAAKRAELEDRWKQLQVAELELYVNRAELVKDQARLIWEAYKSSNH